MKKLAKILGLFLLVIILFLSGLYLIYNENLPEGKQSTEADALAHKLLKAVNHEAFDDTRFLEWSFIGKHHYKWDKQEHHVDVSWDETRVQLNTQSPSSSTVIVDGKTLEDESKSEKIEKAIAFFNNDSFWLIAPHKVFDPGTERRLVPQENGSDALLVTYTSGGSTPGDSYLWLLDESGLPMGFKMWVGIIPIGGLESSWEDWQTTESGILLPTKHSLGLFDLDMGEVKAWK